MAVRRAPKKVAVRGHGQVTVTGLKATTRTVRKALAMTGPGGAAAGKEAVGDLGKRLKEAGEYVAGIARGKASWSSKVPASIKVGGGRSGVNITAGGARAPAAYPNEIPGVRHPVFGGKGTARPDAPWVTNENRPFLAPAGDEGADGAAAIVAQVVDDWAHEHGFR
jgi:hypothetical protein